MLTQRFPSCQLTWLWSSRIARPGCRRHLGAEPVQDLLAGPVYNPGLAQHVTIQLLEITDAVRNARDIGVDADRHDPDRRRAVLVQAIEVITAAPQHFI